MITLNKAILNEEYEIIKITSDSKIKKRLFDLGLIKGAKITPLYKSPLNDPTAYLICGSVIALRYDDAKNINVKKVTNNGSN